MIKEKYFLVFSDDAPQGIVLTSKQLQQVRGFKTYVEIDDVESIPLINQCLGEIDSTPESIALEITTGRIKH